MSENKFMNVVVSVLTGAATLALIIYLVLNFAKYILMLFFIGLFLVMSWAVGKIAIGIGEDAAERRREKKKREERQRMWDENSKNR